MAEQKVTLKQAQRIVELAQQQEQLDRSIDIAESWLADTDDNYATALIDLLDPSDQRRISDFVMSVARQRVEANKDELIRLNAVIS